MFERMFHVCMYVPLHLLMMYTCMCRTYLHTYSIHVCNIHFFWLWCVSSPLQRYVRHYPPKAGDSPREGPEFTHGKGGGASCMHGGPVSVPPVGGTGSGYR
eukprot:GHVU01176187.1.p2 GENE.GHVU01176187.1~~GHVU01176187.1.p2  ORF type:complete len:101 (+),score=5.22 GHVU01176187.1:654-956(+)